jgi:hypothetical protein
MTFLLGKKAMFGHDPPMYLRQMTATRCLTKSGWSKGADNVMPYDA